MFTKLGTRLTVIFVGLVALSVVSVAFIFAIRGFNALVSDSINDQQEATRHFQDLIQSAIFDRVDELQLLNQAYAFELLIQQRQRDMIRNLLSSREAYEEIAVLNPDGVERVRASRFSVVTDEDLRDRSGDAMFQAVTASQEVQFSSVRFDEMSGEPLLTIGVPYLDLRTGAISSVVIAEFRFRLIWNLVAELQRSPAYQAVTIFLLDDSGRVVAHANPSIVLRGTFFDAPSENGQAPGLDGGSAVVASQELSVGNVHFTVVSQERVADALRPALDTFANVGLATVVVLVIATFLVAVVVRQIVRPIEQLSKTAQTIRAGALNARAAVTSRDEIGLLAQSFNDMTARLQNLIHTLEDRVNERVRDLTLASDVSRQITTELDSTRLLAYVAELTATVFKLYHVSIYLRNDTDQTLKLGQGTGKAGEQMVAAGKQFRADDPGLVALAARTRQAEVSTDILQDTSPFQNPLLPDTRSELAIPMVYRGQLIGVLDLHSKDVNRFGEQDVRIMITLAEQISIAVRNAQLFEEAQSARKQAELANTVKSAFLASMSHELRTPLNSVINFTKFVAKGTVGPVNQEQEEMLNEVIDSAKHLLALINDVLDMSKIESGTLNLFVEDNVDLNAILNTVLSTGKSLIGDKPVMLESTIDPALPAIRGDRHRILQVLLNIMSNACKFTEVGTIKVIAHLRDNMVEIAIKDSGPGIAAEDQTAVFEPFQQTDTGLRQTGGTGLGMPISRNLTEAHGGRLWLESVPGKGSTFYLTLPVKSETLTPIQIVAGAAK